MYKANCDCNWCLSQRWYDKSLLKRIWIYYEIWFNKKINHINTDWKDYVISEFYKENKK